MALTRSYLKSMGLNDEQISGIIEAHSDTVEALKGERDKYKAEAEKLPDVQRQLDTAKAAAKDSGDYTKLKEQFDKYKAEVAEKETLAAKKTALQKVAKDAGLTDAGIAKALKYSDFAKIELDDKGDAKDAAALMKSLKEEWAEYVGTSETKGADVSKPPAQQQTDYDSMSDADYYKATYEAAKKGT